ncbi:MAG: DUF4192 domain-containing protein [Nocardioidaceae bacterium]|nr:DUF4192 domain-containing protein [Nocardioidaceae bacterium]
MSSHEPADSHPADPNLSRDRPRPDRPVLRVRSVEDLLALPPITLGFEPAESLVVVAVAGRHPGFQVRVDLPRRGRAEHEGPALANQVTAAVLLQGCTRVAVIAYSHRAAAAQVAESTARRCAQAGIGLLDVLRCDGRRYWSLMCADEGCCPSAGIAYDSRSSSLRLEATVQGRAVMPDRAALAATFAAVSGPDRVAARREVQSVEDEVVALLGLRGRGQVRRPTRQVTAAAAPIGAARVAVVLQRTVRAGRVGMTSAESASAVRDAVTPGRAAVLAVWCSFIPVRDVAWSSMTPADAVSHLALWTAVSQRVVPPYEPAVLALAAFAAWLSGDGASAWCALDRCVEVSPNYSMAALVRETLDRCLPPDVWVPLPREDAWAACAIPRHSSAQ